ncbi:DUF2625 family protein [Streptomyces mirabilis]|uniref:DUF2625 family protein n=1 Tax=Streptomyces mirabilis TaxID=68239 RepID=UPI00368E4742
MRGTDELINVDDPAWPELQELFAASTVPVKVLPVDRGEGCRCLLQMQVTARSVLGVGVHLNAARTPTASHDDRDERPCSPAHIS